MATLGGVLYTTANKTVGTSTGGTYPFGAYLMTMSASGTAETISWRQTYNNGASKAAIYTADKSTLLGETNSQTTPTTGTRQGTIAVPFAVTAGTQYWVVVTVNNDNDSFLTQTNNDGTDVFHGPVAGAGFASYAFPASFTSTGGGNFLGVPGIIVEGTSSSSYTLAVDYGPAVGEAQNVGLIATDALVLPVTAGQHVAEGQEIPFVLTQPGTSGEGAGEGQSIALIAQYVLVVDVGSGTGQGSDVGLLTLADIVVDTAFLVGEGQVIDLAWTATITPASGRARDQRRTGGTRGMPLSTLTRVGRG